MSKKVSADRRNFLKLTAGGVAGLSVAGIDKVFAAPSAWTPKMAINPNIDNMRVISCYDTAMLKPNAVISNFSSQNNATNADKVYANLDEMAIRLATVANQPVPTADGAWKKIFRSSKAWVDTKVAIKANCVCLSNLPRIAIVAKLCKVLNGFGVQGKNIVIYDGCNDANGKYTSYCSLTDTTKVNAVVSTRNSLLGGTSAVTIEGWTSGSPYACTADLVKGNIDILINLAVNKGHDRPHNGYFTMCMKNHYGSFEPPANMHGSSVPFLSINKHDAIIGGNPVRQQLCIIDSLLGSIDHNPASSPDVPPPCRIIMGTFAPAVDYLCAKKIRAPIMHAIHDDTAVSSILPSFGYANTDAQWIEFTPSVVGVRPGARERGNTGSFNVVLSNSRFKGTAVNFTPNSDLSSPLEISIFDMSGSHVRTLNVSASGKNSATIFWDGKSKSNRTVSAGTYVIKATAGRFRQSASMVVGR
jgi:hypothetical protein